MEYTKGEWKVSKSAMGDWYIGTDETLICNQVRHFNARLIAAAPALYEACKQALRTFEAHNIKLSDPRYIMLKQAIARVEGK